MSGFHSTTWQTTPLVPFEVLQWADDSARYPHNFVVRLDFTGELVGTAFAQAMLTVVTRHPLLTALIERGPNGRFVWRSTPWNPETCHVVSTPPSATELDQPIDLFREPGFHAWGCSHGNGSSIWMKFHHACCDGLGARRVVLDLLTSYALAVDSAKVYRSLDDLDYSLFLKRGEYEIPPVPEGPPVTLKERVNLIWQFATQGPVPLRPQRRTDANTVEPALLSTAATSGPAPPLLDPELLPGQPDPGPSLRIERSTSHWREVLVPRPELDHWLDCAHRQQLAWNEVAIAVALRALAQWNQSAGETGRNRQYRLAIPVNLRDRADEAMPAANRMSFVFLTRPAHLCLDLPRLLPTIRDEMQYIRDHGSQYNLMQVLPMLVRSPRLLRAGLAAPFCLATAVLTNLGDTTRRYRRRLAIEEGRPIIGNLRLRRVYGTPPLRPGMFWGCGLSESRDGLTLSARSSASVFSAEASTQMLALYVEGLREWAASVGPAANPESATARLESSASGSEISV